MTTEEQRRALVVAILQAATGCTQATAATAYDVAVARRAAANQKGAR